jgi:hypothetical protein
MKLHFDPNQIFQLDAIAAVIDLFEGQPQNSPTFTPINIGDFGEIFAGQAQTELGFSTRDTGGSVARRRVEQQR